ncbi:PIR protein [Plasmodium brasilianum]|uniref:PIR protein n=1 Tax=Plasmodium brasilianum TaxID=5824 RepID=A0ACB9Y851_PLABR|nr:PIR protein [Plasmodium brasilianum]
MESEAVVQNENYIILYRKYKKNINDAISNFYSVNSRSCNVNPGMYCVSEEYNIFRIPGIMYITLCQGIGVYLFKVKKNNSNRPKRCKYLNYRTNTENKYNS